MNPQIIDAYKLLELPSSATLDEVKKAYRKLAKKHHPDMGGGKKSQALFIEIAEAYELLTDYFANPAKYSIYQSYTATESKKTTYRSQKYSEEELNERIERARKIARQQALEEQEIIYQTYEKTRQTTFKFGHLAIALLCLLINAVLIADYIAPETQRTVQIQSVSGEKESFSFPNVTTVTTYGNELFYAEFQLLKDWMYGNYRLQGTEVTEYRIQNSNATIYESDLLKIKRRITVETSDNKVGIYNIDETTYTKFPLICFLLFCGSVFYLIPKKSYFSHIILFYATAGFSLFGLLIIVLNGTFPASFINLL